MYVKRQGALLWRLVVKYIFFTFNFELNIFTVPCIRSSFTCNYFQKRDEIVSIFFTPYEKSMYFFFLIFELNIV